MQVGNSFDPVEGVFHNTGRFIGPLDPVSIVVSWLPGPKAEIRVVLLDPIGEVASIQETSIPESSCPDISVLTPELKRHPKRPGIWRFKVLAAGDVIMDGQFLVVPISHTISTNLTDAKALKLNQGPLYGYGLKPEDVLGVPGQHSSWGRRGGGHFKRLESYSQALVERWVDELVWELWKVVRVCHVSGDLPPTIARITPCVDSDWSSLSPDPKASLTDLTPEH